MQSTHQIRVEKFMEKAGQDVPVKPAIPDLETRELRAKLILEEALETIEALGFTAAIKNDHQTVNMADIEFITDPTPNLHMIVDGCCDLSVVTIGTLSACGVPDETFLHMVDQNNLAKFGPGHTIRVDGKLIKPPDHQPPAIGEGLERCGYLGP